MAEIVLADTGFIFALLDRRDGHHAWAAAEATHRPPPWHTCDAVLSEIFHLLGPIGFDKLGALLERRAVRLSFDLERERNAVLVLMKKYRERPMSLADACLVRMTEVMANPMVLTTDSDFHFYRRHSRQVVPCVMPR
jgi:predicted nucleic acid-binding protein